MDDQITPNFKLSEFACGCGQCINLVEPDLIHRLQKVRDVYRKPMTVTSGYRCPEHNLAVGGAKGSYHMRGLAADIAASSPKDKYQIIHAAMAVGFWGIGVASWGVHLDLRKTTPVVFTY